MNDFLQNSTINSSGFSVTAPTVANSQVITQVDGTYTNFFNEYVYLMGSDAPVTIQLYIPDMRNGSVLSTINVSSSYLKDKISGVSLIFPSNTSLLELIYMIWYVLFAFWFLGLATNLVTILYSGEIMDNEGLKKLTDTYTGISKNML